MGNFELPNRRGQSAASEWAEASAIVVKPKTFFTPEELAARLKVPDSWVYEKTRALPESDSVPAAGARCRFNWVAVAVWLTAPSPQHTSPAKPYLPNRRNAVNPVSSRRT